MPHNEERIKYGRIRRNMLKEATESSNLKKLDEDDLIERQKYLQQRKEELEKELENIEKALEQ